MEWETHMLAETPTHKQNWDISSFPRSSYSLVVYMDRSNTNTGIHTVIQKLTTEYCLKAYRQLVLLHLTWVWEYMNGKQVLKSQVTK